MANEATRALQWLRATLTASSALTAVATGGVWRGIAPNTALPPWVVYTHQSGGKTDGVAGRRLITLGIYQVVAYGPTSGPTANMAALEVAADAIDDALQRASGPAGSDSYTLSCVMDQPIIVDETVSGVQWTRVGGLYRIQMRAI
jgi:hypothetical protein